MDIAIVGAGLSGLAAGIELTNLGHTVEIYESSDGIGGRVRTDAIDGKLLDRGFQILLTDYPEAKTLLDYDALDLRTFEPGALVRINDAFHRVGDPFRCSKDLVSTVRAPVGSLADKLRMLRYRRQVLSGPVDSLWSAPESTTRERFSQLGFSQAMVDRFLGPLFAGTSLDPNLEGSSRSTDFVFRMLSSGQAAVPARGMGQIPLQLAGQLPDGSVKINHQVESVQKNQLIVNGEKVSADAVVVATGVTDASELCADFADQPWKSVTSMWMATETPPTLDPVLILNGGPADPINTIAVMSRISPYYGSGGKATLVVSSPSVRPGIVDDMQEQLVNWYGKKSKLWDVLRVDQIHHAQPHTVGNSRAGYTATPSGLWLCGDHQLDSSINGALRSGRNVAAALHAQSEATSG